jgi:hypothetical protein
VCVCESVCVWVSVCVCVCECMCGCVCVCVCVCVETKLLGYRMCVVCVWCRGELASYAGSRSALSENLVRAAQQGADQPNPPTDMSPIAPRRRPFRPHFMHLFRLVLTRSRPPESPKATHVLAHLALLVGPEALSHPATAQKSLGRGGWTPPCAPPPAPLRGTWAGQRPAHSP